MSLKRRLKAEVISINKMRTYQKHDLAEVLRAVAAWIENCGNKTVTIDLKINFNLTEGAEG